MTSISEEDKKLLETLGLSDIPEQEKQVVLEEIDNKMTRRFIANLLVTLEPDKARELEAEVQNIPSENTQEIIEKIIAKHPDATKVLQDSAKEIMDELQKKDSGTQNAGLEAQGLGSGVQDSGLRTQEIGNNGEDTARDNDQKSEAQETPQTDLGADAATTENKPIEIQFDNDVKSAGQDTGLGAQVAGEKTTNQDTSAPFGDVAAAPEQTADTVSTPIEEPAKTDMADFGLSAQPAEETPAEVSPVASTTTPDEPQPSSAPAAADKLPVPQEESPSPFGDEIKIVKDDEPTPNVVAPSEEKDSGFRTQGSGGAVEEAISKDTTVSGAPITPSSDLNPFTADKPEPSALESAASEPTGEPILPDAQAQPSIDAPTPPATPTIIPDEPADAPAVTPTTPSPSFGAPTDAPTPTAMPDASDAQPPQTNQNQQGASDYYQP